MGQHVGRGGGQIQRVVVLDDARARPRLRLRPRRHAPTARSSGVSSTTGGGGGGRRKLHGPGGRWRRPAGTAKLGRGGAGLGIGRRRTHGLGQAGARGAAHVRELAARRAWAGAARGRGGGWRDRDLGLSRAGARPEAGTGAAERARGRWGRGELAAPDEGDSLHRGADAQAGEAVRARGAPGRGLLCRCLRDGALHGVRPPPMPPGRRRGRLFFFSSDIRHLDHNRCRFADLSDFTQSALSQAQIFSVRQPCPQL